MVTGYIALEDCVVLFRFIEGGQVTYTAQNRLEGVSETLTVQAHAFAVAMGIALNPDGEGTQGQFDTAEGVMPLNPVLRWIP